ncbi:porin [Methylicorpusculum sp.]|uniref:porin n=1 Tax=Methylicorpusculum sp. TaxID=2713644 RepID=UPI002721D459|nr:porin [Methylicorpusculum sp.]MDO8843166.1 porin [Methylicorpusculum sp.]
MKLTKMKLAIISVLGFSLSTSAFAIDLYMDSETKQLFAEDGPGRIKLGTFEKVEDKTKQNEEMAEIRNDLKNKEQEFKELEERVVAVKEANAKNDEKWFNKISLRGYTQLRYNQKLTGDRVAGQPELRSNEGDKSIKDNSNFSFRRVRLVFSGDINEYVSLYIQPDFATTNGDQNFAQLRDAYADLAFDKSHEYRIRAGQSKVPFGWENLQSSQNRLSLDRADALNSAVPSERDLGLFAYWSPTHVQKLWKDLSLKGLKTSGDYGVLGFGVYNGQSLNKDERNDDLYMVAHATYPIELDFLGSMFNGQVLEVGADAISGKFNVNSRSAYTTFDGIKRDKPPTQDNKGNSEDRAAIHAILFPQPFGFQAEWNWGKGPALNVEDNIIERKSLRGGYVQAMYKIDNIFDTQGTLIPFVKWQHYDGPHKGAVNATYTHVEEIDFGFEWQMMKALELVMTYTMMDRTNTVIGNDYLGQASGDLLRTQLQWNY